MKIATPKSKSKKGFEQVSPAAEIINLADDDDDISVLYSTPISLNTTGANANSAISVDDHYSDDDRDLQRAIMASHLLQSPLRLRQKGTTNNLTNKRKIVDDDDDLQVLDESPSNLFKNRKPFRARDIERGQSSNSSNSKTSSTTFVCEICVDTKPHIEWFSIMGCAHAYCSECVTRYVASKLQDNITQIRCPASGCSNGLLEPEHCRSILPQEVFDRWGSALCEAVVLSAENYFYCPYKDCSALLIDDGGVGEVITEAECPNCRRLFCAQCKVAWHSGIQCSEFQKLDEGERGNEDIMLMNLAKAKAWVRCPNCKTYVEKNGGCNVMSCRCGISFLYNPASPLNQVAMQPLVGAHQHMMQRLMDARHQTMQNLMNTCQHNVSSLTQHTMQPLMDTRQHTMQGLMNAHWHTMQPLMYAHQRSVSPLNQDMMQRLMESQHMMLQHLRDAPQHRMQQLMDARQHSISPLNQHTMQPLTDAFQHSVQHRMQQIMDARQHSISPLNQHTMQPLMDARQHSVSSLNQRRMQPLMDASQHTMQRFTDADRTQMHCLMDTMQRQL